ncbi:hypothetical protein [Streptomyces sp. NPDC059071]|uniref:hypothetical protein n=1 Tax=unclassified Streptomyces TaxID=2593676 RepID=UPI00366737ED
MTANTQPDIDALRAEIAELHAELDGRDEEARERWIQKQLDETSLKSTDFRNGIAMDIAPAREAVALWVGAARSMLGNAPNYSETPIEMTVSVAEDPERFVFTLQRAGKLTPHEARQKAEARAKQLEHTLREVLDAFEAYCPRSDFYGPSSDTVDPEDLQRWRAVLPSDQDPDGGRCG